MMLSTTRPLTLIITLSLILAIVFHVADAHLDTPPARRNVPAVHRILKKRAPAPQNRQGIDNAAGADGNRDVQNAAQTPPTDDPNNKGTDTAAAASTAQTTPPTKPTQQATSAVSTPATPATPARPTQTGGGGLVPGLVSDLLGAPSSSSSSSTSTSSTSTSSTSTSTSSTSSTSTSSSQSSTPTPSPTALQESNAQSQVTVTSSSTESPTATGSTSSHSVTKLQRNTIIILIAIGASIGAAGLIWTIIRKWKFRPSSSFEDRMQPIDWQPTTGAAGDRDITEKLGRSASSASHGSFTSGNHNHSQIADLPQHDFTAGAAHLAPVGGYADLQRGPSPRPDMHAGPNYRSPSPYQYDIPNTHGAYYNNNAGGYQGGYDNNRGY